MEQVNVIPDNISAENPFLDVEGIQLIGTSIEDAIPELGTMLWIFLGVIVLYAIIHAVVFVYHWKTYNIATGPFLARTYITYFSGIGFFLALLLFSTIAILI